MGESAKEEQMQQRGADDVRAVAAGCYDWFADSFDGVPLSLRYFAARVCRRCCLDASEGGLLLFVVAFDGQGYEAVYELLVR
jgi:hypothetical protein